MEFPNLGFRNLVKFRDQDRNLYFLCTFLFVCDEISSKILQFKNDRSHLYNYDQNKNYFKLFKIDYSCSGNIISKLIRFSSAFEFL